MIYVKIYYYYKIIHCLSLPSTFNEVCEATRFRTPGLEDCWDRQAEWKGYLHQGGHGFGPKRSCFLGVCLMVNRIREKLLARFS